jgi:hypothetical protein
MNLARTRLFAAAFATAATLSSAHAAAPFEFVPVDSPYVFGAMEPMPAAAAERMKRYSAPIIEAMKSGFKQGFLKSAMGDETADVAARRLQAEELLAFFAQMGDIYTDDAAAVNAGFLAHPQAVVYGVGLVPVLRVQIGDAAKVNAMVLSNLNKLVELSKKSNAAHKKTPGKTAPTLFSFTKNALRGGQIYRLGAEKVQPIIVVEGGQFVVSLVPAGAKADVLNLVAPAAGLGANGVVSKLNAVRSKYGVGGYGVGFFDFALMAKMYLGQANRLETALWQAVSEEKLPAPTPQCRKEISTTLGNMPRLVFGYTGMTSELFSQKMVLELAPDIAKTFASAAVAMPAYGEGAAFKMGFAVDPLKTIDAIRIQANKITDAPYQCEAMLSMNESAVKLKEGLSNPMLGMAAMVKGFGLSIDSLDMDFAAEKPEPRNITANAAVFSDQPEALLAMAQAQLSQLASVKPTLGGKPVKLDAAIFNDTSKGMLSANEGYAALTKSMVILGVGKNRLAALSSLINAPATGKAALEVSYGSALLLAVISSMEKGEAGMKEEDKAGFRQMLDAQRAMMGQIDNFGFSSGFTPNGFEMTADMRFKK